MPKKVIAPQNADCWGYLLEAIAPREAHWKENDQHNDKHQCCQEYFDLDIVPPHFPPDLPSCALELMRLQEVTVIRKSNIVFALPVDNEGWKFYFLGVQDRFLG